MVWSSIRILKTQHIGSDTYAAGAVNAAPFSNMGRQVIVNAAPTLTPLNLNLDNIIL